jgi:cytochrome c
MSARGRPQRRPLFSHRQARLAQQRRIPSFGRSSPMPITGESIMKSGFRLTQATRVIGAPVCAAVLAMVAAQTVSQSMAQTVGDAARGEMLYQTCKLCHSLDKNEVGPMHRGVVGRAAGAVPNYDYSQPLKASKIVWTESNLDKWLTNPQAFVPGTKMLYQVDSPQDRADIIAFLKERAK